MIRSDFGSNPFAARAARFDMAERPSKSGKRQPAPIPCTFHIVYWESGVGEVGLPPPPMPWPEICDCCEGVKANRLWNLDSVHASIRHLAKEGSGFRTEVEDFVYVSPQRAIAWDLHKFKEHNAKRRKKVLSE